MSHVTGDSSLAKNKITVVTNWATDNMTTSLKGGYHLCVECFSQLSFDLEVYTKSAAVADLQDFKF